jgi:hypothetical protein
MSSFICSSKHFNSIQKTLEFFTHGKNYSFPYELKTVCPKMYDNKHYSTELIEQEVREIVNALRELNVYCVLLQYKHHYEGRLNNEVQDQLEIIRDSEGGNILSLVELFKALTCVRYQIELEHLKELRELASLENRAMSFLNIMINDLACEIVRELPAYDDASWEIN